jgi:prevent-host-death family protein
MKSVAISALKTRCLALLEDVARTGTPLLVTKRGKPLARVTRSDSSTARSPQETLWNTVETIGDIIAPASLPEAWNAKPGILLSQDDPGTAREPSRRRSKRRPRG